MPPLRKFFENERSIEHVTGEIKLGDTSEAELEQIIDLASYPTAGGRSFTELYTTLNLPLISGLLARYDCETLILFCRDLITAAIRDPVTKGFSRNLENILCVEEMCKGSVTWGPEVLYFLNDAAFEPREFASITAKLVVKQAGGPGATPSTRRPFLDKAKLRAARSLTHSKISQPTLLSMLQLYFAEDTYRGGFERV